MTVQPRFAHIRASAVVPCRTGQDVAKVLERGETVAVRGGGHDFAGRSSTTGIVIDISPMRGVRVDGDRAVIGAGTRLAEVYEELARHGRTIPAGCGPTVGIAGLTLGGGLGILGRRHGLTCDSLLAATMVDASGRTVEADDDLLWALRGGGAPGVVTSLTFRTIPAPESTAFRLTFRDATDALEAWQHALPGLDESLAPSLVITEDTVTVFGAAAGPAAVDDLIRKLGQQPLTDERRHGPHQATKRWLAGTGEGTGEGNREGGGEGGGEGEQEQAEMYLHSEFFRETVPAADLIARLHDDRRPGEHRELDFSPWGGAYNRIRPDATAFPHRDARFLLKQTVSPFPTAWLDESYAITHPHGTGGVYPNFPEPGLPDEAYYLENTARLRRIRALHDPYAIFDRQRDQRAQREQGAQQGQETRP
jgi:hypothetical protein